MENNKPVKVQMSSKYGKFAGGLTHGELPIDINGVEVYDVSSMYPQVDKLDYDKLYIGKRETKTASEEVFKMIYNHAYNDALNDVLEKLKKEVNQHHKFGIEGFKVGICHSRILIAGMKRE
jgi:hypothetical protein